jgi:Protein of unknown function (DUF3160)
MRSVGFVTVLFTALSVGCSSAPASKTPATPQAAAREGGFPNPGEALLFEATVAKHRDMTFPQLRTQLGIGASAATGVSFDPTSARYYDEVAKALSLTAEERAVFAKTGMVSVDHQQSYSMGSAYYAIYAGDLPVFVTTDSILHALHRSYDKVLSVLEERMLGPEIETALQTTHEALSRELASTQDASLRKNLLDVDLYLTVARRLLAAPERPVGSVGGQDDAVSALQAAIEAGKMEKTSIYGGGRTVDFSQFQPRGHYTETEYLKRYFRAMMWLGRADLGFNLMPPAPQSGMDVDVERERTNAAVMTLMLDTSGAAQRLSKVSGVIDFMVGSSDDLSPMQMRALLSDAGIQHVSELGHAGVGERLRAAIETAKVGAQRIRSQVLESDPEDSVETPPPALFQTFGQRFIVDSFVLSKVVFDSILFQGKKQKRMMPSGLDVMAAMGNDEAVRLLEPELTKHNYSANLFAAREVVRSYRPSQWDASVYNLWLDALRTLDDAPGGNVPELMRTQPWQRKQLQTQLGSWAELRHDTILYGKQSYTAYPACEYPEGFVEPYPEFFARVSNLATRASALIGGIDVGSDETRKQMRDGQVAFFQQFAKTISTLESLARKELASESFTSDEEQFLKKVIDMRGGGSGPPRYDGWYPKLVYGGEPSKWKPSIADVHTDPESQKFLHVGTGNTQLLVVAVDNEDDRTVYVGPVYSFYEFESPTRMTDEQWEQDLRGGRTPARPGWASVFTAPAVSRRLGAH